MPGHASTGPRIRVNSWNSWDPLRRVIVGRADAAMVQAPELAIRRDWPEHGFPLGSYGPIPQDMTAAATEQLDNFADLLRRRGIQVDRPEPLDFSQPVSTPMWTATADQLSHLGFEVIPVPFWDVAPFGGGLHCATADIERDGGPEDYFPHRYGRF